MELFKLLGTIAIENTEADEAIDSTTDKAEKSQGKISAAFSKIGSSAKKIAVSIGAAGVAIGTAFVGVVESTREYRTEMAKLETAFVTGGHSVENAKKAYSDLNAVLGDTGQAVEAANHLAKLTDNEKDLQTWTDICTGVFATFGDSLPIEGLTEAANETAKVGQVTGPLADALNWAGISEDAFNKKLAACTSEQERQKLIMETLNDTYQEASAKYKEVNEDVLASQKAQERLTNVLAQVGAIGEPILTALKNNFAALAEKAVPVIENLVEKVGGFISVMNDGETRSSLFSSVLHSMFTDEFLEKVSGFTSKWSEMAEGMKDSIFSTFSENFAKIKETAETLQPTLQHLTENGLTNLMTKFDTFMATMETVVVPIFNLVSTILTDLGTTVAEAVAPGLSKISDTFTTMQTTVSEAIQTYILPVCQSFIEMLQELYTENEDKITKIGELFSLVFDAIATVFEWFNTHVVQGIFVPAIQAISTFVTENMDTIKNIFQSAFDIIGGIVDVFIALFQGDWQGMWDAVKNVSNSMMEQTKEVFNLLKEALSEIMNAIWSKISEKWESIKLSVSTKVSSIVTSVKDKFGEIKDGIVEKLEDAKTAVSDAIEKIKGFFDFEWKLPDLKLPHIVINGEWNLAEGTFPSFGVEWYAKGAVLNQPTAFGVNGNNIMAGGEAGPEAIAPIDVLQGYVAEAVARQNAGLIEVLQKILAAIYAADDGMKDKFVEALEEMRFDINNREFARLVKSV